MVAMKEFVINIVEQTFDVELWPQPLGVVWNDSINASRRLPPCHLVSCCAMGMYTPREHRDRHRRHSIAVISDLPQATRVFRLTAGLV
jgi:hypothetical protein